MLQDQVVPIDLGSGVDTKTDPKLVVPGKLLRLENAVFTRAKRLSKRNGYSKLSDVVASVGTLDAPKLCHTLGDELILADQGKLLSWSPLEDAWMSRGEYTSVDLSRSVVNQADAANGYTDVAVLNGYALYGWSTSIQPVSVPSAFLPLVYSKTYASVVDLSTNTVVSVPTGEENTGPVLLSTNTVLNNTILKCVRLGTSALAILYTNEDLTEIMLRTVVFGGAGVVTLSAEVSVSTDFSGYSFDVVSTPTGAAILYGTSTGVNLNTISTSGVAGTPVSIASAGASAPFHVEQNTVSGEIFIYWCTNNVQDLNYAVYSSTLTLVLAANTIITGAPITGRISNIIATPDTSVTSQTVYFGYYTGAPNGLGVIPIDRTDYLQVDNTGGGTVVALFAHGVAPFSRGLLYDGNWYAAMAYRGYAPGIPGSNPQPTALMVKLGTPETAGLPPVVARFAGGVASTQAFLGVSDGTYKTVNGEISFAPNMESLSASAFLMGMAVTTQEFPEDYYVGFVTPPPGGLAGSWGYTFDFNGDESYTAVNAGEMAVLSGACVHAYDGVQVNELNFHMFPEQLVVGNTGGGNMGSGTYSYLTIFQWTDANGNLHQSAPSLPSTVVVGAAGSTNLTISTAYLSQKRGVSVAIYRTKEASTGGGGNYYLITNPVFLIDASAENNAYVTYLDTLADSDLDGNPFAYAYPGNAVLENTAPPPCTVMIAHNNRLWMVDAEEQNSVWYTKSFQQGVGLSPTAFLVDQIDPKFGSITSMAEMDEKIVLFKQQGICVRSGDGANDIGQGSTLSFPQFVPSDVGCSSHKSTVTTPDGVMFKSDKGIYMLSRGLAAMYMGLEVEQYNSQRITSAKLIDEKSQIRFLCASGLTLVYDYIFKQWSTFTNHTGLSATIWMSDYTYVRTDGDVYVENVGYLDDTSPFLMLMQTSWLALGSVQGFQRARRVLFLGDYANGSVATHGLVVQASYDFDPTLTLSVPYTFGAASSSGVFQYRERLQRQKCDAISLTISEANGAAAESYVDLSNLSFEIGVKRGANKLTQPKTVG